ncbi:MAG: hypothetical protein WAS73_14040 [Defluviicoccus sp.]
MTAPSDLLRQIFMAGDGEIVGRIRLQKIAYLLQQKGGNGDLFFTYHHYGPYSRELAEALDWAVIRKDVEEEERETGFGSTYSAFRWKKDFGERAEAVGEVPMSEAKSSVAKLKTEPSVILELAATIHWLRFKEQVDDWREQLKIRKQLKATDANITRAETVLRDLGLVSTA